MSTLINILSALIVRFTPVGSLLSTNVQSAIAEEDARVTTLDGANVKLTGTQTIAGIKTLSNKLTITDTTASTSSTTGALLVPNGGIGIGGNLWIGSYFNVNASTGAITSNLSTSTNSIAGILSLNNSSVTHPISGTLNLNNSTVTHTISGGLSLSKLLTTNGRKSSLFTKTANYTTVATDEFILVNATSGTITITLLSASTAGVGATITVQKIDSSINTVTVTPVLTGGTLMTQYASANFVSDGTNWYKY